MRRSAALTLAIGLLAFPALAACGGGNDDGSSGGVVNLTFRQFDPPDQISGLQKAVDSWNGKNPNIQVKLETLTDADGAKQFAREANSGSGPDVIQIANANVKDLANPKILLPVDDTAGKNPADTPLDKFLSLDMVQFDDKTWALPWTVDTFALVYQPDLLEQTGVSVPKTWEDLAADGVKTAQNGKRSGFCFPGGSSPASGQWFPINYYLWSHGGSLVTNEDGQWKVGATVDQLAGTVDYFNGLFTSGATASSFKAIDQLTDPQITNGVVQGTCAMTMMAPQTFRNARANDDSLQTAPAPEGLVDGNTHLGGRSLGINASSEHPEEAWQFIKYLNSSEAFSTIGQYPAAATILADMKVPEGEEGYKQQLPHAQSFARYIGGPVPVTTLQKIVNAQFGAVYSGQTDSHGAAQAIIDQIQAELDRS